MQGDRTIIFITGECLSHYCWEEWQAYFERRGFKTLAPSWIYKDAPADVLRSRHPDEELGNLNLDDITNHYRSIINTLEVKPVVVAHAGAVAIAENLVNEEAVAGAVFISEEGFIKWIRKTVLRGLALISGKSPSFLVPYCLWRTAFAYRMPRVWQQESYRLMIPESTKLLQQLYRGRLSPNHIKKALPELHIAITGKKLTSANTKNHPHAGRRFGQRNYLFMTQPGWQEIALYISDWLTQHFSPIKTPSI